MKKIYSLLMPVLMSLSALLFSACEQDPVIAYTLEGTWQGNMYVTHNYEGYTYHASKSEICFLRDPYRYSSGTGYWVDYYSNAPWDYIANHIEWTVQNHVIKVYFVEDDYVAYIEDYRLDDNYFMGTIYDEYSRVDFRLVHVDSPNWNDYDYGYYDYYAKPNALEGETRSVVPFKTKPVRGFAKPM